MSALDLRADALLHSHDPERLAEAIVAVENEWRVYRDEILDPAKRRLGEILNGDDGPSFVAVGDRIVEGSWSGVKRTVDVDAICAALREHAPLAPRQLDPATGEVETDAAVVARILTDVFANTKPRTTALDRYLGSRAIRRFSTTTDAGHPSVSIRRPTAPTRPSEED